tara:strand:+ start:778 stop:996 length:219 start_codon:yes stop_codon:yes gene_type:complete
MYKLSNQPKVTATTKKNMMSIKKNCRTITPKNAQACLGYRNTKLVDSMNPLKTKGPTKKKRAKMRKNKKIMY